MALYHTNVLDNAIKALPTVATAQGSVASFETDLTEDLIEVVCEIQYSQASGTPTPTNPIPITVYNEINVGQDANYDYFIDFNQLVKNGNFTTTSDWINASSSFTVLDNVGSFVANSSTGGIYQNTNFIENHIYLLKATIKSTTPTNKIRLCANRQVAPYDMTEIYSESSSDWQTLYIFKKSSYSALYSLRVLDMRTSGFDAIEVKNVTCSDLTQLFVGSTLAEEIYAMEQQTAGSGLAYFENIFPNEYYDYTASTIETIGTANNDGTGHTYNIPFGQNVAKGTLNVTTGVLTITHGYISSYNGESINEPWVSSIDEYVENTNPSTGAEVVYPLTTPTIIQLDSKTLQSLLNENNIWCDTNGDTEVKYILSVGKLIS